MTVQRVRSPLVLAALVYGNVPSEIVDTKTENAFDAERWLSDSRNVALRIGEDLGLFEYFGAGVYQVHTLFHTRGKVALGVAREILAHFRVKYEPRVIYGETPVLCPDVKGGKAALFFARLMGMRPLFSVERPMGMVVLTVLELDKGTTVGTDRSRESAFLVAR